MPSLSRTRKVTLCVIFAFLIAVSTAQSAFAVQSGRVTVSSSPVVCVQGESTFNWFTTGFADRSAWASTYAKNPGSCAGTPYRPHGWLAAKLDVFKWTGSQWSLCRSTGWAYGGGGDTRGGDIIYEQAAVQSMFFSSPPCGAGHYGTSGSHFVWTGSEWQGNSTWSGHTFAS